MTVELTPEQVNEFLSKAILQSQIGNVVKASVDRSIADLSRSYDNPFDRVIKQQVEVLLTEMIRTQYKVQLESRLLASLQNLALRISMWIPSLPVIV